jgi:hypothetical protein
VAEFILEPPAETVALTCGPRALTVDTFATALKGIRVKEGDSVYIGAQLATDTPGTYYLRQAGGLVMGDGAPRVSDVYGEETDCIIQG